MTGIEIVVMFVVVIVASLISYALAYGAGRRSMQGEYENREAERKRRRAEQGREWREKNRNVKAARQAIDERISKAAADPAQQIEAAQRNIHDAAEWQGPEVEP